METRANATPAAIAVRSATALAALLFLLVGCNSTTEFNPYVAWDRYETVQIADFEGPGLSGYQFAERVARAIAQTGRFQSISRTEEVEGNAVLIRGKVTEYESGHAGLRLKYGPNVGRAKFSALVRIEDLETGDYIGTIELDQGVEMVGPRRRFTPELDELAERAAREVAEEILLEVDAR